MSNAELAGRRVLVVEDDYFIASDLAGVLQGAGADVIGPVGTVRDALDTLREAFDAAMLDVQLGDETSFPIADELARAGCRSCSPLGPLARFRPRTRGERSAPSQLTIRLSLVPFAMR